MKRKSNWLGKQFTYGSWQAYLKIGVVLPRYARVPRDQADLLQFPLTYHRLQPKTTKHHTQKSASAAIALLRYNLQFKCLRASARFWKHESAVSYESRLESSLPNLTRYILPNTDRSSGK